MGVEMTKWKFAQIKTTQIADKLANDMSDNLPNILSTIYNIDKARQKDESEEALDVL